MFENLLDEMTEPEIEQFETQTVEAAAEDYALLVERITGGQQFEFGVVAGILHAADKTIRNLESDVVATHALHCLKQVREEFGEMYAAAGLEYPTVPEAPATQPWDFQGMAPAGSRVEVTSGGELLGTADVNEHGSYTIRAEMPHGQHTVLMNAYSADGEAVGSSLCSLEVA